MPSSAAGDDGHWASVGLKDNFYQTSAFIPMSFALVTTVHESGETGIGPHALLAPFGITAPYSMLLISRGNSGTAVNIRRQGLCALNYISYDAERLKGVVAQGLPGQNLADKQRANPYTLCDPPANGAPPGERPQIIREACQVMECSWDSSFDIDGQIGDERESSAAHFVLRIDRLLMDPVYVEGIDDGKCIPQMPVFYGFRANGEFWFAEHHKPFSIPVPKVEGLELQSVIYLANRIDARIHFTDEACSKLTGIPRPFMKEVLQGITKAALDLDISEIDAEALEKINANRNA